MFSQSVSLFFTSPLGISVDLNFWVVMAGILIIILCLLSLFLPSTKNFISEKTQEFSGLGVSMKVSILTVFVLIGFILSFSSFALQLKGYLKQEEDFKSKLSEAESKHNTEVAALNSEIKQLRSQAKIDMSILVRPVTGNEDVPVRLGRGGWTCKYWVSEGNSRSEKEESCAVGQGGGGDALRVHLRDIGADTHVYSLELQKDGKKWAVADLEPFSSCLYTAKEAAEEADDDES